MGQNGMGMRIRNGKKAGKEQKRNNFPVNKNLSNTGVNQASPYILTLKVPTRKGPHYTTTGEETGISRHGPTG